jgi:hypothetical protein
MSESTDAQKLAEAINKSGFPFQLGLKMLANSCPGWRASLTEHPWHDPISGSDKFIDLVLRTARRDLINLVVECKRARSTQWLFIRESVQSSHSNNLLSVRVRLNGMTREGQFINDWTDVQFTPGSPEANFCVVRAPDARELLEKTASEVVRATAALADQELALQSVQRPIRKIYVPIIVSNATMYICDADWKRTNLETGEVDFSVIEPVDFVRFRKSFSVPDLRNKAGEDIAAVTEQSAHSVMVVQAAAFLDFLTNWNLSMPLRPELKKALGVE